MVLDVADDNSDDAPMTELRALILRTHDSGESFESMAIRARKAGFRITKQYFNEVARGRIRLPKDERLAAIAAGLPNVTEDTVREAAARSANVHVAHNISFQMGQLLSLVRDMSPTSRDRWYRLAMVIAHELAAEESAPPRTIVASNEAAPDKHTQRVLQRELDEALGRTPKQQRRQDP